MKQSNLWVFGAVVIVGLLGGTSVTAQLAHAAQGGTGTTPLQKASPFLDKLLPASRPPFAVQSMFYKCRSPRTGNMWDTWMSFHEGTYYLYYLGISGNDLSDNVSMAVSPDGVHWKEIAPVGDLVPRLSRQLAGLGIRLTLIQRESDAHAFRLASSGFFPFWEKMSRHLRTNVPA